MGNNPNQVIQCGFADKDLKKEMYYESYGKMIKSIPFVSGQFSNEFIFVSVAQTSTVLEAVQHAQGISSRFVLTRNCSGSNFEIRL